MTAPGRYLAKARESLASAEADLAAGRFNSVANRAYYAAFQAAVAMLVAEGVQARGSSWEHKFVLAQFSVTLVRRRKLFPGEFRHVMQAMMDLRLKADYQEGWVTRNEANRMVRSASTIVSAASDRLARRVD